MRHRHLKDDVGFTPPAIDDIISRGLWQDWVDLRNATKETPSLLESIEKICVHQIENPHELNPLAQRHRFWLNYVRSQQCAI